MKTGHFIMRCKECDTVISQCRCMDCNKEIRYGICAKCDKLIKEQETK